MHHISYIIRHIACILLALLFFSCVKNFDELNDTNQRHVTFTLDNSALMDNVLVQSGNTLALGAELPEEFRLRIAAYCYDMSGLLTDKKVIFSNLRERDTITIKHLDKANDYRFLFVADIVRFDSPDQLRQTWLNMGTGTFETNYLVCFERDSNILLNQLFTAQVTVRPHNSTMPINLHPATCNGFLRLDNTEGIDKVSGDVILCQKFYLLNNRGEVWRRFYFDCNVRDGQRLVPITFSAADNEIELKIKSYHDLRQDSTIITQPVSVDRPFLLMFDVKNMTYDVISMM